MGRWFSRGVTWLAVSSMTGCAWLPFLSEEPSTTTSEPESVGDDDDRGDDDTVDSGSTTEPGSGWQVSSHPCVGNRTDTLWVDDAATMWVGCGTTTNGYGMYVTRDGGQTWSVPATDPDDWLTGMRVDSISRSSDGRMYVAGLAGGYQVVSFDDAVEPAVIDEEFTASGQLWDTWQVGSFRRNSEGLAVAESLNGYGLAARWSDDEPFSDGADWNNGSYQLLDLQLFEDRFYGVGSTISQPPMVFLPPTGGHDPAVGFQLVAVTLVDGLGAFGGELWSLDVDESGVVAVGVNQDADEGVIFVSGEDPYVADQWTRTDLGDFLSEDPTWLRGVCKRGDTVVVVGEYSTREDGIVLRSTDGGVTFEDLTPGGTPSVQECEVFDDGSVVVAGMDGWFGTWTPAPETR